MTFRGLVICLVLAVSLAGCTSSSRAIDTPEAAIVQTLHDACKAYRDGNVERMETLLTPDFTLTDSAGVVTTRDDDVLAARTGTIRYTVFENHDMKVRVYGDAAVVTGITRVRGNAGATEFQAEFQFTDTVVRQNGMWRVAASHVSRLPAH